MEARHGVYVLVNSETHGIVKIGETTRHVNDRIPELHQTGTIGRFKCVGFIKTDGRPALLERKLHVHFREHHVNNEYYRVSPEDVIKAALKLMGANDNVVISPIDVAEAAYKQRLEDAADHQMHVDRQRREAYERAGREEHAKRKEELRRRKAELQELEDLEGELPKWRKIAARPPKCRPVSKGTAVAFAVMSFGFSVPLLPLQFKQIDNWDKAHRIASLRKKLGKE